MDTYRADTLSAANAAAIAAPQTAKVDEYTNKIFDMYSGKSKFELSAMPNANVMMGLYDAAKNKSDRGRIGKGLAYGGDNFNPNLIASIDEQNQNERELAAQGALEGRVTDTFAGVEGKMLGLGQIEQNLRGDNFNRRFSIYNTEAQAQAQRDAKPKWWESLLAGGVGVAASYATGGMAGKKP